MSQNMCSPHPLKVQGSHQPSYWEEEISSYQQQSPQMSAMSPVEKASGSLTHGIPAQICLEILNFLPVFKLQVKLSESCS